MEDSRWQELWHDITEILGKKWSLHVIRRLVEDEARFNEIKQDLDGLTSKMLSKRLDELGSSGLVSRRIVSERPLKTEYSLTESGERLAAVLLLLEDVVREDLVEE